MAQSSKAYVQAVVSGSIFVTRQGDRIRLARVDAPETGMPMAELARGKLKTLIHKQWVDLRPVGREGADLLCEVWSGDKSINDAMRAQL